MSPEELAERHPRLYHLTDPDNARGIERLGLLPTRDLLSLFDVQDADRRAFEQGRRATPVALAHPVHGEAVLNDNLPLTEAALASCLDDGLTPAQWLLMLNARVFFWPDLESLENHRNARFNRGRERLALVFDTLRLTRAHWDRVELCPINSGSTLRKPARRGLATFTPAGRHGYQEWRRLRGGLDRLREVTILGGVPDAADYLLERFVF